jgi:hypothetical protein
MGLAGAGSIAQAADVAVPADKCAAAWSMASPGSDTLAKGAATPLVLNFTMVDLNKDGAIDVDLNKDGAIDQDRVQQGLLGWPGQCRRSEREGH